MSEFLEILALLPVTLAPIYSIGIVIAFIALLCSSYWYIAVLYLTWQFYDQNTPYQASRPLSFIRKLPYWRYLAHYFPLKLHKTADLDPSKNYIFAVHPHGALPYGSYINIGSNATGFDELFPGLTVYVLTKPFHFRFPFYREYAMAVGAAPASAESIDYKLTQIGAGHSVCIAIGGGYEISLNDHHSYTLKLATRKGFIRRALKTGASVVPVFTFNEQRTFEIPPIEKGSFGYYLNKVGKLVVDHNTMPTVIRGRWWWAGLFVPKKVPLDTVFGAPLDFAELKSSFMPGQEAPEDVVNRAHIMYMDALRKLYDDHKARFGDENTPLIFV